jgi:hypothetical protein
LFDAANKPKPNAIISSDNTDATLGPYMSSTIPMQSGPRKEKKLAATNLDGTYLRHGKNKNKEEPLTLN